MSIKGDEKFRDFMLICHAIGFSALSFDQSIQVYCEIDHEIGCNLKSFRFLGQLYFFPMWRIGTWFLVFGRAVEKWVISAWVTRVDMELQTNLPRVPIFAQGPGRARGRKWGPVGGWYAIPYPPKSPRQKFHFILSIFPKKMLHNFRPVGQKYFCRLVCKNITE